MEASTMNDRQGKHRRRRIKIEGDVERGNPAEKIIGKAEEQSARVHKPLPKKRKYTRSIGQRANDEMRKDIGLMNELERYVQDCEARAAIAKAAIKALEVK